MKSYLLEKELEIIWNDLNHLKNLKNACSIYNIPCPVTDEELAIKGLEYIDKMQIFIVEYLKERRLYNA